ncbi:MAG: SUMF1/EgtB/PvdO family nonheme iron enzyme [Ferruginibacter sp.]|nr:SUMF1/EgtB/PvdO family nonheme iron enzyme [Chitinophagaceae bacterium]
MKRLLIFCAAALLFSSFNIKKKARLKLPQEFVLVPGGTMHVSNTDFSGHDFDSTKRVSLQSFYISRVEVSNLQYRQFYNEAVAGFSEGEQTKIRCDSTGWRQSISYNEPMVTYYHNHPAYNNYPVVNISQEGAIEYCRWLQQKLQKENPDYTIEVKLPAKNEWIWAAQGGRSQAMFPWGNYYLRNKKGEFLCNFKRVGDQAITRNRQTGKPEVHEQNIVITGGLNDRAFYTAAVKSFYPNDFGLYNMCGNAAEMIAEKGTAMGGSWNDYGGDVQIRAEARYESPLPTVGFRPIIIVKKTN